MSLRKSNISLSYDDSGSDVTESDVSDFTVKDEIMFQVLSEFLIVNKNDTSKKNIATVLNDISTQLSHIKDALQTIASASSSQ